MIGVQAAGPLLLFRDADGCRHAVRAAAVLGVHEGPQDPGRVAVTLAAGRVAVVEVGIAAFVAAWRQALAPGPVRPRPHGVGRAADDAPGSGAGR